MLSSMKSFSGRVFFCFFFWWVPGGFFLFLFLVGSGRVFPVSFSGGFREGFPVSFSGGFREGFLCFFFWWVPGGFFLFLFLVGSVRTYFRISTGYILASQASFPPAQTVESNYKSIAIYFASRYCVGRGNSAK